MTQKSFLDVNSLRPESLNEALAEARKKDGEWILQNKKHFIEGLCPLCDASAKKSQQAAIVTTGGIAYTRCPDCNTLFINPQPTEAIYKEFYARSEIMKLFSTHIFPASQEARVNNIYMPRLHRMLEYYKKFSNTPGNYVEIGAGSGTFTQLVKQADVFADCIALEPAPSLAESCLAKGLTTIAKPIEDVTEPFTNTAVMACFEVLEHLQNPKGFLKKAYAALPSHGMFFLTTPNGLGFDILELGGHSTTLGITHVNLFNPHSISALLHECGFEVLDVCTPGVLDVDLVYRHYAKTGNTPKDSWLASFLLGSSEAMKSSFQNFLVSNLQSSHMWAVAIKP